jgi:TPR repeat protein
MRAPHLLGPDWEAFRWYETAAERDDALERLRRGDVYYRPGDVQSLVLERVDR